METVDLVRMINQIADYFSAYPEEEAIAGVTGHLESFWEPRMRRDIIAAFEAQQHDGMSPLTIKALGVMSGK